MMNTNWERLKMQARTNYSFRAFKSIKDSVRHVSYRPLDFLVHQIKKSDVNLVLDVGANLGQFAKDLMLSGYSANIISFEPVKSQFEFLNANSKSNCRWTACNFAFGDVAGEQDIIVTSNSGLSSSFLEMNDNHTDNFPFAKIIGNEKVRIETIHDYVQMSGIDPKTTLLKLDVQGFESKVLSGCKNQLKDFALCFIEVSLKPLYDNESTYLDILKYLSEYGQQLIDVRRGVGSNSGDLLQMDILTRCGSSGY